ncbi:MAG: hypothetical protein LBK65_09245 [Tannerellaceae bacterium]|jgi:hypothetical protein|nr:hypothetical protein [Tannerellaceae bacterium]
MKLKHLSYFFVAAMIATSACTKIGNVAETGDADGNNPTGNGRLAFVLPQVDRVVTYTGASMEEGGSTSDVVAVYVFNSALAFERSYNISYAGGEDVAGGRQYSLTMDGTGERNFVFLQAPSGYPLPQLSPGNTLETLTAVWTQQTGNGKLSPPFVTSNALTGGNPYITVEDIAGQAAPAQVSMKRRVARLDIENNSAEYTILGVDISNAAPTGRMFDSSSAPAAPSNGVSYALNPEDLTNNNRSFYLYPTVVKADGAGTGIKIRTRHNSSSVEKTFTVMTGVDIAIEANRLYRLTVSRSKQTFDITIADWADADEEFATVIQPAPQIDIYLCMGQSNMVGYSDYVPDYTPVSNAYVYNSKGNSWVAPSNPISAYNVLENRYDNKIGVHYGFLLDMVNYYPNRKVAIVLNGWGGKPIADFLPGSSTGYYSKAITAVKAAALMSGGTIRGVLWHQGENDSGNSTLISAYEGKLTTLVNALRTDLGISDLPFVAGEVVQGTANNTNYSAFNAELNRIAGSGSISNLYVVQSDGLTSQDAAHFSGEGMVTLGQRYAAMVHSILSGTAD